LQEVFILTVLIIYKKGAKPIFEIFYIEKYINMVEKHKKFIHNAFEYIWKNPEIGYRDT